MPKTGDMATDKKAHEHVQALLKETEKLLEKWKHPDPYIPPTAPGGMPHTTSITY